MDKRILKIKEEDNVATAMQKITPGEELDGITALQEIPFGHKISVVPIKKGGFILKYGEVIGAASRDIKAGEHVHIHNMEGTRGRGDIHSDPAHKE
jgi:altronate dehydratase